MTTFKPTKLRGTELLNYVLGLIQDQVRHANLRDARTAARGGAWDQGSWGKFMVTDSLLAHSTVTDMEATPPPGSRVRREFVIDPADIEAQISDNPQCGTAMCFAGHTAILAGGKPVFSTAYGIDPGEELSFGTVRTADGGDRHVSTYAAELLGLDTVDADELFSGDNTLEDLEKLVADITANGGELTIERCYSEAAWPWRNQACGSCTACTDYAERD